MRMVGEIKGGNLLSMLGLEEVVQSFTLPNILWFHDP